MTRKRRLAGPLGPGPSIRSALAEEFDCDFRRDLFDCPSYFPGGIGQPSCVDVYSNTASRTVHVFARLKIPNCLPEFVPAFRTLESDRMCVNIGHLSPFQPSLSFSDTGVMLAISPPPRYAEAQRLSTPVAFKRSPVFRYLMGKY